jgi:hypothetical protein
MLKRYFLTPLLALLLAGSFAAHAQTGGVGIGTTTPAASAALDITSTTKGLLLPRLTLAQRTALTNSNTAPPVAGLVIYQSDNTPGLYAYDGTGWVRLGADGLGSHVATQNLDLGPYQLVGNGGTAGLAIGSGGNVGVGTTSPTYKLQVAGSVFASGEGTGFLTDAQAPRVGLLKYNGREGGIWRTSSQDFEIGRVSGANGAAIAALPDAPTTFTTDLYVGGDGKVGLGTGTPAATLDVNGALVLAETASPALTGLDPAYVVPANVSTVRLVPGATAPTGLITLSTTAPAVGQHLTVYNGTGLDALLGDQLITAGKASLLVYSNGGWRGTGGAGGPGTGDDLGSHVATQNINLNGNKLVGGTTDRAVRGGLALNGNGLLTLGATRVSPDSTTRYGVRLLDIDQDVIITSKQGKGQANPISVSGAGDRMMWLSYYSAFRAGGVTGDRWNYTSSNSAAIGNYSAAFGLDNQAGSTYSTAFGWNNRMRNCEGTLVTGINNDMAQSFYGVVMGGRNSLKGWYGLVGGYQSKVLGSTISNYSAAVGAYVPNWPPSLAFGQGCYARSSRGNTYTLGYYARSQGYYGSFVLADMSPLAINTSTTPPADRAQDSVYSTNYNQMTMRFAGGYRLFTTVATRDDPAGLSPLGTPVGVQLSPGSNSWSMISDSTKKERRVLADGNRFLASIGRMRLGSWNYIGQSPDTMRHYGPMAQDFYAAFGHDGVGRSGNSTTINQADFDGVNLIAIQALYRRVLALEAENARLRQQVAQQPPTPAATLEALEARLRRLEAGSAQTQR